MTSLDPVYKIGYQIVETLRVHDRKLSRSAAARSARSNCSRSSASRTPSERVDNYPHEFSGGMRQRVVIAIAMANDPGPDHRGRADDRTGRDGAGDRARGDQGGTGGDRRRTRPHHPRPRHHRRHGRTRDGHVRRHGGRDSARSTTSTTAPACPTASACSTRCRGWTRPSGMRLTPILGTPPSLQALPPGCPFSPRCPMYVEECSTAEPACSPRWTGTSCTWRRASAASELIGQDRYEAGEVFDHTGLGHAAGRRVRRDPARRRTAPDGAATPTDPPRAADPASARARRHPRQRRRPAPAGEQK